MNLTEYTLHNRTVSWMVVLLLISGGILSFLDLGRLEDPAFTIKQAVVITEYPGASSLEVEEEITLPIENAIQQLTYVDKIVSVSSPGLSQIEVEMKSTYRKDDLAQIWDEMRRKINDMQGRLPPGARTPIVNDDFADVYGVFLAITGKGYSYEDLADYTDFLRRELVLVDGVGKVSVGGRLAEQIFIEVDRAKLTASGFSVAAIRQLLTGQSLVNDAGHIQVGSEYLRISTLLQGAEELTSLGSLLLGNREGRLVYLSDVAKVSKGYAEPPTHLYRFNAEQALSLGISFAANVNVVEVGERIQQRLAELEYARPLGIETQAIYDQPGQVKASVDSFLVGLVQAVVIVIVVLMFTMGLRPGLLMSGVLLITISGTFIVMNIYGIELHRISLGALIIALGMLVDNAIVVTEGIMISLQRGKTRMEAAISIVSHTRWPLLGATIIAITAFAPIGLSPDASGEFTGSLFWVLFISLLLSWVLAVTITPFFCYLLFKEQKPTSISKNLDPYRGIAYRIYRVLLHITLRFRWSTMALMLALLVSAVFAFGQVKQAFFPDSSLPLFMVDYWLPEGTDIRATSADIQSLEQQVLQLAEVKQVTATIGRGAERFMLTYQPEKAYSSYAQLLVQAHSFDEVSPALEKVRTLLYESYPQAFVRFQRPALGPSTNAKIEARISGPDPALLRQLGKQIITLFDAEADAINVRHDWRERSKVLRPVFDAAAARRLGISQADLDRALKTTVIGQQVGTYRHGSEILPIIIRPPENERRSVEQLKETQVYSPVQQTYVNVGQFMRDIQLSWEDPLIKRRDRKRTLSVLADPGPNSNAFALHAKLRGPAEALPLPPGYSLEWGGEYEAQQDANKAVFEFVPLGILVMIIINVFMFNSIKQTLVIWITVPLAIIGVAYGLLLTGAPFSFTALLAVLSLIGMQIKNGIVLVEEIKRLHEAENQDWHSAISDAAVSRLRPVSMAAVTTILGMLPLLGDVFFQPMAVTIMFGLGFATVLTLIVVPVLFALFYGVRENH
ncbi:efflux RND transporter permease subunit [Candidatus Venteria ishoeyi]|uniref:Cobalt-zinc-cadmium resistance protein CzcA n=1 Tax=Candidatus Venteria ishoeyi TaxID=1899563 RepID=A0A1H6FA42_9GAMM|nr:efflux RND transporter permease subunit [Candidatus Venteria ishoeyi]SEH05875.1 Cobalt-zinc-cadmium resistance protein CzcA [Candidatus Venteria ishoeyi]